MCNGFGAIISKKVKNVAWDEYKNAIAPPLDEYDKAIAPAWDDMISCMSKITGYVPER